ncbi:hypothetical protein ABH15_12695 [Methanoculleus taiwanensis]|uniref:Methyltransferase domain-containing protein n=1 Tax=Methanoculleus taiwanensis TaxID=1550565 RepID=A0A498GZL6_9EURY|nr:class I SAM-dependent methyltransferase [Methanoculleus taiwanensis]RXE55086.1 hypothetical protein ABH15_12695 [Methanoculleus taiwanensis]
MTEAKTEKEFWEHFWKNTALPCRINPSFSNDRVIAETLKRWIPAGDGERVALEVGCAPGKWMVYLAEDLGYVPAGCEYVESAVRTTEKNLELCCIPNARVYHGDFLTMDFEGRTFDLILSLGFIEHFSNPEDVIRRKLSLLNDGGYLAIGIPKFTGLNYHLARIVDETLDRKLLPAHNLAIMDRDYFCSLPRTLPLAPVFIDTIGGFEPALFDISRTPLWFKGVFHAFSAGLANPIVRCLNLGWCSGYIMAIYRKDGALP